MLAVNDYEKLSWGNNIYRIGVLGNGSCFFHSILTATDKEFHLLDNEEKTTSVVAFRLQIAHSLTLESFLTLSSNGVPLYRDLPREVEKYKSDSFSLDNETIQAIEQELNIIYNRLALNVDDLKEFLKTYLAFREYIANPLQFVGDELHLLLSNILELDIYLTGGPDGGIGYVYHDPVKAYKNRRSIIIFNVGGVHWETVGQMSDEGIITTFEPSDSIIRQLRHHNEQCWNNLQL